MGRKLTFESVGDHCWMFRHPHMPELEERFCKAVELTDSGKYGFAEVTFRSIIKEFPEHMDATHYLSSLLRRKGKRREATELAMKAVDVGKACFPKGFSPGKDRLEWGFIENRPFLRAYHNLGLLFLEAERIEKALSVFEEILALNPNDNQGIRALAIECYFILDRPEDVLKLCDRYKGDAMAETMYGRALANLRLGRKGAAGKGLKGAFKYHPLVAKELVKTKHRKPKSAVEGYITVGGEDEAYEYWRSFGRLWEETPGALEFLREFLAGAGK